MNQVAEYVYSWSIIPVQTTVAHNLNTKKESDEVMGVRLLQRKPYTHHTSHGY